LILICVKGVSRIYDSIVYYNDITDDKKIR